MIVRCCWILVLLAQASLAFLPQMLPARAPTIQIAGVNTRIERPKPDLKSRANHHHPGWESRSVIPEVEVTTDLTTLTSSKNDKLGPLEQWCVTHVELWYKQSLSIKCPFFKRRAADFLDAMAMVLRFLVIRHKSLDLVGPPPGCGRLSRATEKVKHSTVQERIQILRSDWKTSTDKGYYVTGRLTSGLYRDDCLFEGPDPDMPVRGLRKYINAASHLFDHSKSTAQLISLEEVQADEDSESQHQVVIRAKWKIQGVLNLPSRPQLPEWTGSTTYYFDQEGLIERHEETWDMSVLQAFTQTLAPQLAKSIWDL